MILVMGATGTNGREVVDRLLDSGATVRAMVREPEKADELRARGAEVVAGDYDDHDSLEAAFQGVDRAFFLAAVAPKYVGWFDNMLKAAQAAGSPHLVKFSGLGADPDSSVEILRQHGQTDAKLRASGVPFTILRPNSFYQNLLWSAGSIKAQGAFYLPLGEAKQSLVDVRDIARVAARVLTETGHEGQTYEITGPDSLTYAQVAEAISAAIDKPVQYVPVPPEAALDSMRQSGMAEWNARAVSELYGAFARGIASPTTDTVERLTGKPPISIAQFARDHASAFA